MGWKKNTGSVIRTNWLDTVGPMVQEKQHFKVISYFLLKKILKMAQIRHTQWICPRYYLWLALCCIGCPKKKYSIKLKKKCTKKWRSPTRELKTWYVCNNIIVFLFMKKYFSILNFYGWYGHLNVKFWQFWHWPNVSKFCSKIVLCLLFLLQKKFPV